MKNSPIVVLKFGSSVLLDVHSMPRAVHEIYHHVQRGERVVAIVSALSRETDQLLSMVRRLDEQANPYRIAVFVGSGEQKSALLMCIALECIGLSTHLISPADIGLVASGPPLDADPCKVDLDTLKRRMSGCQVAVLPGFIACDDQGRTILLGRGGSDDTALFIAQQHQMSFEVASTGNTGGTLVGPGPTRLAEATNVAHGPLRVALFGAGTVGYGVYRALAAHPERFEIVADDGQELEELAHRNGLLLKYSATVGGGVPIIESINGFQTVRL